MLPQTLSNQKAQVQVKSWVTGVKAFTYWVCKYDWHYTRSFFYLNVRQFRTSKGTQCAKAFKVQVELYVESKVINFVTGVWRESKSRDSSPYLCCVESKDWRSPSENTFILQREVICCSPVRLCRSDETLCNYGDLNKLGVNGESLTDKQWINSWCWELRDEEHHQRWALKREKRWRSASVWSSDISFILEIKMSQVSLCAAEALIFTVSHRS